jgi:hypothetical protein
MSEHPITIWVATLTPAARDTLSDNDVAALRVLYNTRATAPRPRNAAPLGKTMRAIVEAMEIGHEYRTVEVAALVGKSHKQITTTLGRLADKGEITCLRRGHWVKEG